MPYHDLAEQQTPEVFALSIFLVALSLTHLGLPCTIGCHVPLVAFLVDIHHSIQYGPPVCRQFLEVLAQDPHHLRTAFSGVLSLNSLTGVTALEELPT